MTIGDEPAFPSKDSPFIPGMTYRQWLVGQLSKSANWDRFDPEDDTLTLDLIFHRADAIIRRMEGEK